MDWRVSQLEEIIARVLGTIRSSEDLLIRIQPKVIVVASQHSVPIRALLHVARELGIPTAYVPHAPFANNCFYADLPVDLALLRGQREVESYTAIGADPAGLIAIGNTMLKADPVARMAPRSARPVIAPSPWESERLNQFLEIALTVPDRAIICPHPASDRAAMENFASRFDASISNERTSDLLQREGGVVIQSGSGVALEAMLMGVPVVDVQWGSSAPNYPCIADPFVTFASDSRSLAIAHRKAATAADSEIIAAQRWALEWSSPNGPAAADNLSIALSELLPTPQVVLDGWRTSALHCEGSLATWFLTHLDGSPREPTVPE